MPITPPSRDDVLRLAAVHGFAVSADDVDEWVAMVAGGVAGLAPGRVATEDDRPEPGSPAAARGAAVDAAMALADRGVRPVVVRFAPTVHGDGDHGFTATMVAVAREKGLSGYVGDGANRWPAVHRADAARLVALAVHAGAFIAFGAIFSTVALAGAGSAPAWLNTSTPSRKAIRVGMPWMSSACDSDWLASVSSLANTTPSYCSEVFS